MYAYTLWGTSGLLPCVLFCFFQVRIDIFVASFAIGRKSSRKDRITRDAENTHNKKGNEEKKKECTHAAGTGQPGRRLAVVTHNEATKAGKSAEYAQRVRSFFSSAFELSRYGKGYQTYQNKGEVRHEDASGARRTQTRTRYHMPQQREASLI